MRVINARNVNDALVQGMHLLTVDSVVQETRNGKALKSRSAVATVTENPTERVLFYPWRDANPFFHFYESLWMLAGRRDVKPLTRYVKRMGSYSDDGTTLNAAYGHRWRHAGLGSHGLINDKGSVVFERDQLTGIVEELQKNPNSRQCVLQIWDHKMDLGTVTKDHACNIAATFQVSHLGALEMVVFCRSNDAIWGCHGANAVHFSMLQEYVAVSIGRPVGSMTQVSVNYHAYCDVFHPMRAEAMKASRVDWDVTDQFSMGDLFVITESDPYKRGDVRPFPIMQAVNARKDWDDECQRFVTGDGSLPDICDFKESFFRDVAWHIVRAHDIWKKYGDVGAAVSSLDQCVASDWRRACAEWLERRRK